MTQYTALHNASLGSFKLMLIYYLYQFKQLVAKIGYQPNCHVMLIASDSFSAKFCLAMSHSTRLGKALGILCYVGKCTIYYHLHVL